MICQHCKARIRNTAKYCGRCGTSTRIDYSRYINRHTQFARYDATEDIRALNNLFAQHGLSVTEVSHGVTLMQYHIRLNVTSNVPRLLKMQPNLVIVLNDNTVRLYQDGNDLIVEKRGAKSCVYLGDLYTQQFIDADGLTIMLGKDARGKNVYTDLSKAPHMLVAGYTGSGKSIFLHSIIDSLLIKHPGIEIYAVDTKMVEFNDYSGLPTFHLVTDAADAIQALKHLCDEMDYRYAYLQRNGNRDIAAANKAGANMMPIVCVIDELADLMLLSRHTVESYIVRLAQKARAAGIHLVLATQRPTTNVVTGLIKANIPTRVCFKTYSAFDSRIVLDRNGGESLFGQGDMLFMSSKTPQPVRIQGCFMEEQERRNIATLIYNQYYAA